MKILQTEDHLPLAKPYLISTQKLNIAVVNEAYNDLLIEEEDHTTLRSSLETYDQYDALKLAKRLEGHELLEFRRIAALLYRVSRDRMGGESVTDVQLNNMYEESLGLSKADRLWRDSLETAASSKDISVAEELAGYFVSIGNKDAFAAVLYVCHELVRPDFVDEMVRFALRLRYICVWLIISHGDLVWATLRNLTSFNSNEINHPRFVSLRSAVDRC